MRSTSQRLLKNNGFSIGKRGKKLFIDKNEHEDRIGNITKRGLKGTNIP